MVGEDQKHYFVDDEVPRSVHGGGKLAAFTIALEAWRRGLAVTFLDARPYKFNLSDGSNSVDFDRGLPLATTRQAFHACNNKSKALRLMAEAGVPVPAGVRVDSTSESFDEVTKKAYRIGFPVVLKPTVGSKGRGVFVNISDETQLKKYYKYVTSELGKRSVIIEEYLVGEDYRIFVVGDKVAAATWRRPASVVGDGLSTVSQLVAEKNRRRQTNPALSKELITRDLEVDRYLDDQDLSWGSVPARNLRVRLRGKANLSTGGEIVDVTHLLPPSVRQVATRAVAAVPGLVSAGVDVMIDRKPLELDESANCRVIELNPRAHIGGHMFPSEGPGHNAAGALVDYFFPQSLPMGGDLGKRVSFDIDDVLAPLRGGVVERSTIAALPEHGYPYRRIFMFSGLQGLNRSGRDRISRNSRRWDIAGSLSQQDDGLRLLLAGQERDVHQYCSLVAEVVGGVPSDQGAWEGVVWKGFKVLVPGKATES